MANQLQTLVLGQAESLTDFNQPIPSHIKTLHMQIKVANDSIFFQLQGKKNQNTKRYSLFLILWLLYDVVNHIYTENLIVCKNEADQSKLTENYYSSLALSMVRVILYYWFVHLYLQESGSLLENIVTGQLDYQFEQNQILTSSSEHPVQQENDSIILQSERQAQTSFSRQIVEQPLPYIRSPLQLNFDLGFPEGTGSTSQVEMLHAAESGTNSPPPFDQFPTSNERERQGQQLLEMLQRSENRKFKDETAQTKQKRDSDFQNNSSMTKMIEEEKLQQINGNLSNKKSMIVIQSSKGEDQQDTMMREGITDSSFDSDNRSGESHGVAEVDNKLIMKNNAYRGISGQTIEKSKFFKQSQIKLGLKVEEINQPITEQSQVSFPENAGYISESNEMPSQSEGKAECNLNIKYQNLKEFQNYSHVNLQNQFFAKFSPNQDDIKCMSMRQNNESEANERIDRFFVDEAKKSKANQLILRVNSGLPKTYTPSLSTFTAKPDILMSKNNTREKVEKLQHKVKNLQKQLVNNKIFLNMVIHDMRNPTNSIEFAVKEVLRLLNLNLSAQNFQNGSPLDNSKDALQLQGIGIPQILPQPSWKQKSHNFQRICLKDKEEEKIMPLFAEDIDQKNENQNQNISGTFLIEPRLGPQEESKGYLKVENCINNGVENSASIIAPDNSGPYKSGGAFTFLDKKNNESNKDYVLSGVELGSRPQNSQINGSLKHENISRGIDERGLEKSLNFNKINSLRRNNTQGKSEEVKANPVSALGRIFVSSQQKSSPHHHDHGSSGDYQSKRMNFLSVQKPIANQIVEEQEQNEQDQPHSLFDNHLDQQKNESSLQNQDSCLEAIVVDDELTKAAEVPKMEIQDAYYQLNDTANLESSQPYKFKIKENVLLRFTNQDNAGSNQHFQDSSQFLNESNVSAKHQMKRVFIDLPVNQQRIISRTTNLPNKAQSTLIPIPDSQTANYTRNETEEIKQELEEAEKKTQIVIKPEILQVIKSVLEEEEEEIKVPLNVLPALQIMNADDSVAQSKEPDHKSEVNSFNFQVEDQVKGSQQKFDNQFRVSSRLLNILKREKSLLFPSQTSPVFRNRTGLIKRNENSFLDGDPRKNAVQEIDITESQKAFIMDVENVIQQFQDKGLAIENSKKQEIDNFLKNSIFSATMLLNLINDLLDLAKMENSAFNLNQVYFDLFEVIEKSAETLDSQLQQKNIYVTHSYQQEDRIYLKYIYGDQHRYLQILLNFMSNAVKFTPNGGKITVKTFVIAKQPVKERGLTESQMEMEDQKYEKYQEKRRKDENSFVPQQNQEVQDSEISNSNLNGWNGQLKQFYIEFEMHIIDTGCGISKENISKLFMNFNRLEEHQKMNHRGTGLGLSICKSLIELMGGSVTVKSDLGKGTAFIIHFKTKCKARIQSQITRESDLPILQDSINQKQLFQSKTPKVNSKFQKGSILQFQESFIREKSEDRKKLGRRKQSSINAHNYNNPMQLGAPAIGNRNPSGFGGFAIQAVINSFKSKNLVQGDAARISFANGITPKRNSWNISSFKFNQSNSHQKEAIIPDYRILIANDDNFQLKIISRLFLQNGNFLIDEAENGLIAVEKYRANSQYDLILLDLDMPIMTGYEACLMIRQDQGEGGTIKNLLQIGNYDSSDQDEQKMQLDQPINVKTELLKQQATLIIAYSGFVNDQISQKCLEAGFDDVVEAPLTEQKLQTKIIEPLKNAKKKKEQIQVNEELEKQIIHK